MAAYWCFLLSICSLAAQPGLGGINPLKAITNRIPRLNVRIEKLFACEDSPDTPIQFQDIIINQVGFNQYRIWGKINVTEQLYKPLRVELEMNRCGTKGDASSCEYYFTYKKTGVCDLLHRSENIWESFTKHTDLPKECPFPPKVYYISGSEIDLQAMSYLPVYRSSWKLKNKGFQGKTLIFCLWSEVSLEMTMNYSLNLTSTEN